jgi:GTPase SAR1 family protein
MAEAAQPPASSSAPAEGSGEKEPVVIIVIGMAGSGKTTLMQRLNSYLHAKDQPPYILNLDPAVSHMPYAANIDIRDTVDYKEVMKQYNLGPNGGIMTALNLFTTKFDQVLGFVEKRAQTVDYVLVDTPGQIEIFTWSASGAIITDAIASSLPTCVAYVIDTPRTTSPATFMSNMLYACSILYKTRLPFILVFNKIDVEPHDFAIDWMKDFEAFQAALEERGRDENGESYMNSLMGSMCLVLEEFYNKLRAVGVSAMTGAGMKDFFNAVEECRQEYLKDYRPELERLKADKEEKAEAAKAAHLERMMRDMGMDQAAARKANPFGPHPRNDREDAYLDHYGDSEDEAIEAQREMEEEADDAPELGKADVPQLEFGGRDTDVPFPAPR